MNHQHNRWRVVPPKSVSLDNVESLLNDLRDFMPTLKGNARFNSIKVWANKHKEHSSFDDLNVTHISLFELSSIDQIEIKIRIHVDHSATSPSCEAFIRLSKEERFFSVSDNGSNLRDGFFDALENTLIKNKILPRNSKALQLMTFGYLRLQYIIFALGLALLNSEQHLLNNIALPLIGLGLAPAILDILTKIFPPKSITIIKRSTRKGINFNLQNIAAIVTIACSTPIIYDFFNWIKDNIT